MNSLSPRRSFKPSVLFAQVRNALAVMRSTTRGDGGPSTVRRSIALEPLEPRLLLSADLTYADPAAAPAFDAPGITGYVAGLISTNFTLKAEDVSGATHWRLYGTGTDITPIAPTVLLDQLIDDVSDLDVNITRSDLGLPTSPIGVIDFIGDRLTIDVDSLALLNGQFAGTTIDIDFAGGKDIDLEGILGIDLLGLPLGNDQVVLSGDGGASIDHALKVHSSSDIVNDGSGLQATFGGDLNLVSDSTITIDAASALSATNITLLADATGSGLFQGLLANGASSVTVSGATLNASGTVTLTAHSKVAMNEDGDGFFQNSVDGTIITSFSTAEVRVVGSATINAASLDIDAFVETDIVATNTDPNATVKIITVWAAGDPRVTIGDAAVAGTTTINVSGNITADAKTDLNINATSKPATGGNSSVDAALVNVNIVDVAIPGVVPAGFTNGADLTIGGNAYVHAGGSASFGATDIIVSTAFADGNSSGKAGATAAVTVVDHLNTVARLTDAAAVDASSVTIAADTTRNLTTRANATPGGAAAGGGTTQSQNTLSNNNASTSQGAIPVAAAIAVSTVSSRTTAFVDSSGGADTSGDPGHTVTGATLNVTAHSTDAASAIADGKYADGSSGSSLAVGVGVAINNVDLFDEAYLGGSADLLVGAVNVDATMAAGGSFRAEATSGAGGASSSVSLAGSLAINAVDTSVRAFVKSGANVNLHGASLTLSATNATHSVATAQPHENVAGKSLGLGASVAINLVDNVTEAVLENGASLAGGNALTLAATGTHELDTTATAGAKGGVAITPVVALTFTNNTTRAVLGTDDQTLGLAGALDATATQNVDVSTKGLGDAEADGSLALGAALALTSANETTTATTLRNISAGGNVGLKARSGSKAVTESQADAGGSDDKGAGNDANSQAGSQRGLGDSQAASRGKSGSGGQATPGAQTSDGPVTIAAAFAISLTDMQSTASVGSGVTVSAGGALTLSSLVNDDAKAVASGDATKGNVGVGVAVAVAHANLTNRAAVESNASVSADGATIEAAMLDVSGNVQNAYETQATAGAGAKAVGIAGGLALTITTTDVRALLAGGSTATMTDGADAGSGVGALAVTAREDSLNHAASLPKKVSGDTVGIGASVALSIADHTVMAEAADGAAINGAQDISLLAQSSLVVKTEAKGGAEGGVAITPVAAIALVNTTTSARMGTKAGTTSAGGAVSVKAVHDGETSTRAEGATEGGDVAVGASLALTLADDQTLARSYRSIAAGGSITVEADTMASNRADATASAKGAEGDGEDQNNDGSTADNKNVDEQVQGQRSSTNSAAASNGASDSSGNGSTPQAKPSDNTASDSDGAVSVAAAISINLADSQTRARIEQGTLSSTSGTVTVRTRSNHDSSADASGVAAGNNSVGIGAAVSVNKATTVNDASVSGAAVVSDGNLSVQALMNQRETKFTPTAVPVVSVADDTIFVGYDNHLSTGDKVKYTNNGGNDIGGLSNNTDYYVIDVGAGKIKLATSESNAKAGTAIDLGTGATGNDHKLDPDASGDDVIFDPAANRNELVFADAANLRTGDAVVYQVGAGSSAMGGLTNGHTYFLIVGDKGHADLAASYDDAMAGKSIAITSLGSGANHSVVESIHATGATAMSGAGGTDVGIAGSVAINLDDNDTRAAIETGAQITLTPGAQITVTAEQITTAQARALPDAGDGDGATGGDVGVGASFALNVLDQNSTAEIQNGVVFGGSGGGLAMAATGTHVTRTEAENGAAGDVAVGAAVAVSIVENDTTARLGTGGTISLSGAASVVATHGDDVTTSTGAKAAGKDVGIGASVSVALVSPTVKAELARSVTSSGGGVTLTSSTTVASVATATASAGGGSDDGGDADDSSSNAANNNSNNGGDKTVPKADDSSTQGNDQAQSQSGSGASGVGAAASVAVNAVTVSATATVSNGADIDAAGAVSIRADTSVDAKAQTDSTAVDFSNGDVNVGAAVALNIVKLTQTATVGSGSTVHGNGVTLAAETIGAGRNDYSATAYAAAGNKSGTVAGAATLALNVVTYKVQAMSADNSTLDSSAAITVSAEHDMGLLAAALSGGVSLDGVAFGGSVAINLVNAGDDGGDPYDTGTFACIGNGATSATGAQAHATGLVTVKADTLIDTLQLDLPESINNYDKNKAGNEIDDPDIHLTSLALAAGGSGGSSGVAGSVSINLWNTSTRAFVDGSATVTGGSLLVKATDLTNVTSAAGAVGAGLGGAGVAAGLDLLIFERDTRAYVGSGASVNVDGTASVEADSTDTVFSLVANAGVGDSAGVAGSASVQVIDQGSGSGTRAYIDGSVIAGGNLKIHAQGNFSDRMIAGAIGAASSAGVGVSNTTLVLDHKVAAYVGDFATARSTSGNLTIEAISNLDLLAITATAGVAGTAAVGGSVTVSVIEQDTDAHVGRGATADAGGTLAVTAQAHTTVTSIAGSVAASGSAAVGVGVDVGTLNKTTQAYLDSGVASTVGGDALVVATSTEDLVSVVAGFAASGGASVTANPSIHYMNITTLAHIGDDPAVGPGPLASANVVDVTGSILISADDDTEIDKVSAGAAVGVAGVALAASVTVIDKRTDAFIGTNANVVSRGFGAGVDSALGVITASTSPATPGTSAPEAQSSASYNGSAASVGASAQVGAPKLDDDPGKDESTDGAKSSVEVSRTTSRGHTTVHGIAISATNSDDLADYSVAAGGGTVGVAVSGSVNVVTTGTHAFVGTGAHVNAAQSDLDDGSASQSVRLGAGNDFHHMAVTVAAAGGFVGVAPGIDVTVTHSTVGAEIGDSAIVKANNDVTVDAHDKDDIVVVTVGVAGGAVAVGGAVSVLSITDDVDARIGSATVYAGDSVGVRASSDSHFLLVDGAAGGGFVGAGVSVGVLLVDKTTDAVVDNGAHVDAVGNGSGLGDTLTGTLTGGDAADGFDKATVTGLVVQATSSENLLHIAVAGGGGFVGVSGAIAVTGMDSDTNAEIRSAQINQNTTGSGQNVYVNAANETRLTTIVGAIAGGVAGIGGAVDIGQINNDTSAKIRSGAVVRAGADVSVNALAIKELDGFTASAAGGVVGLGAAVSVWSIGTPLQDDYNGTAAAETSGTSAQQDAGNRSQQSLSDLTNMWSGYGGGANPDDPSNRSRSEASSAMGMSSGKLSGPSAGDVTGAVESPEAAVGTVAVIEGGANVTAGTSLLAVGGIGTNAVADVEVDRLIGQFAFGLVGAGAAVGITSVHENVFASTGGTLNADGAVRANAALDTDFNYMSVAGQGGLVGVGASVVVLSDTSTVAAEIGAGAVIDRAGSVHVTATTHRNVSSTNIGVTVGGVAIGASFSDVTIGGSVAARVGANANIGQNVNTSGAVGSLELRAEANEGIVIDTTALAAGAGAATANFGYATVDPSVTAEIGIGARVKTTGDATVDAVSEMDGSSTVRGVAVGGGALAASIASVTITPNVTASVRSNARLQSTTGAARVRASHNTLGQVADASAAAGSGGVISGSGASATVTHSAVVAATGEAGSEVLAGGDAELRAFSGAQAKADAGSLGIGAATMGTSTGTATVGGSVTADFSGSALGGGGANVFVQSFTNLAAEAVTVATTGGVIGVSTNQATGIVNTAVKARIGSGTTSATGGVTVNADADAQAKADSGGIETSDGSDFPNLSVLGGIGLSASDATLDSTVTAEVGAANVSAGGTLLIRASHNEGNSHRAKATSSASGGSLGVSVSGADSEANSTADVYARAGGPGAVLHGGTAVVIRTANTNQAEAITDALGIGLVAGIGASDSTAITHGHSEATIVDGSGAAANQKTQVTGGALSVDAGAMDRGRAVANGAGGGLFAGGTSNTSTVYIAPIVIAEVGQYTDVNVVGAVSVIADSAAEGDALTEGTQGSAGLTIGDSTSSVNIGAYPAAGDRITVAALIDDHATVRAASADVEAMHNYASSLANLVDVLGGTTNRESKATANSSGGGAVGISSASATTTIRTDVDASINAGASVTVDTFLIVDSQSEANGAARASSFQGGLGAFGLGQANVKVRQNVDANVGAGAVLVAGGDVKLIAQESSSSDNYGASAGGGGIATAEADANTDILSAANVNVGNGAQITAQTDIFVFASQYFEGSGYSTSESYGAGASAYSTIKFTVDTPVPGKATAGINVGQDANLYARRTLTLDTQVDGGTISSHGFSQVGALAGDADTDVITVLNTMARVDIQAGAVLFGEDKVDILSEHKSVFQDSGDFEGETGIRAFGYAIGAGDARFTYHLNQKTYVMAADGATVASRDLLVRTLNASPGSTVSEDEDGTNLLDWEEYHGDWSPDRQIGWDADVILLSGPLPELVVRADGFIETAINVSVTDGGVVKGQGDSIVNTEFQVNNIENNDPGHARFEANTVTDVFANIEFADLGAFDGEAGTHPTSQIYGNDGTWYARRTFDAVTLINHSAKKMIVNDIRPVDRDGDPDGEVFINLDENAPSGKDPFNFRIVNQFEPTLVTVLSDSASSQADIQFNGEIDNPIGNTVVTSASDILSDGSQLIRTNLATFVASGDIGTLVGNVGAGGARTALRVDLVQSSGRPEDLEATAGGNIVLDLRGVKRDTGAASFTVDIGTVDAGKNVDVFLLNASDETIPQSTGSYALIIDENFNGGVDQIGLANTPDPTPYIQFFKPDQGADPVYDFWKNLDAPLGVFGTFKQTIESTYHFDLVQAGRVTDGADIQLNGELSGVDVNIDAVTNIFGSSSGLLYALSDGDITLEELAGDMRLGRIKSTEGDVELTADVDGDYDIIDVENLDHLSTGTDTTAEADVTGRNITLHALNGYIGEPCIDLPGFPSVDFIEIDSSFNGVVGTVNAEAQNDIYLDEITGAMHLGLVRSFDTDVDLHTRAGAVTDGNGAANNIEAHSIDLVTVGGGVGGSGDDVEIDTDAASGGATDGRLFVVATANGAGDAGIYIAETADSLDVLRVLTDKGDIRLTVPDTAAVPFTIGDSFALTQGENLVLLANGETLECSSVADGRIQAERDVTLRVGDNVELTSMTSNFVLAGRNVDIFGDWGNADPDAGTVMNLRGEITSDFSSAAGAKQAGERTRIFGDIDDDRFNYWQTRLGGDTYNYGSQFVDTASASDDGEDRFYVDRLQDLTTVRGSYTDSKGNELAIRDALTLDGQDQTDTYVIVTHGSKNANGGLGGISDYLVNALDTGASDDGVDTLTIEGSGKAILGDTAPDDSYDDVFLLRGQSYLPGHDDGLNSPALSPRTGPVVAPAFVALMHGDLEGDIRALGGDLAAQAASPGNPYLKVERINYDQAMNGRLMVYGYGGNDYFASDDNSVITTLDGGAGSDRFQIGQLYRSEREYGNVADANDFAAGTVQTTRGYLSRGISAPMTIYGGTGNDSFSVYSNKAELRLEGNDGNDEFIVRAFALETGAGNDGQTLINGGDGDDNIQYNINAPVSIDGGAGFDRVVALGTEFSDNFVITEDGIYGAGLKIKLAGNEELREVDGLEGNDNFWVLGTPFDVATRIIGGLGSDDVNTMGDVTGIVVSRDLEGVSTTIDHQVSADPNTDPFYNNLLARGVDLNIATASSGQIVIDEPDGRTVVSESALLGGTTDFYNVYLSSAPTAKVYVTVSAARTTQQEEDGVPPGDTFLVSTDGIHWQRAIVLTFNAGESGAPFKQQVFVKAVDDARAEGARTAVISHSSISADPNFNFVATRNVEARIIDDDKAGIYLEESFAEYDNGTQVLEEDLAAGTHGITDTYSARLASAPTGGGNTVVELAYDASEITLSTADARYDAATHRITYTAADWFNPVVFTIAGIDDGVRENREISPITHTVISSSDLRYLNAATPGPDVAVEKLKVSIVDTNSEGVLVTESFGRTLVVQDNPATPNDESASDTYTLRLTKAPVGTVTITTIPLSLPDADGGLVQTVFALPSPITFDASNWWLAQEVTVTANPEFQPAPGTEFNKYFSKRPHTVSELFGPLEVLGGVGPEDRSLVPAIVLPGETNSLSSDGNILSFSGPFTPGATNAMVVEKSDLVAVVNAAVDDVNVLGDLIGFSVMISKGPGLDRFWRIDALVDNGNGTVTLTLENPGRLENHWIASGTPDSTSEYAVLFMSTNFFVDEMTQIDKLNVFNDTSVADDVGTVTSTSISGLGMGPGVGFDTNEDNIADLFFASGISYATYTDNDPNTLSWYKDIEVLDLMLGRGNDVLTVQSTLQTLAQHGGLTVIHGGGNTPVAGVMGGDTIEVKSRTTDGVLGSPLVVFGDTSADGYRYSGQSGQKSPNAMNFAFAGRDTLDAHWSQDSVTMYGGANDDLIIGSQTGDTLAGGSGDDRIFGQQGNDHLYGDSGVNIDVNSRKLVSDMAGPQLVDQAFDPVNPLIEKTGHDRAQSYAAGQLDDLTSTLVSPARPGWADSLDGGADLLLGELGNDIVFGDHGIVSQFWAAGIPQGVRVVGTGTGQFGSANERLIESRSNTNGRTDTIFGNEGDDVLIGGAAGDRVDGNQGMDLVFGDNVSLDRSGHVGDPTNPRFRVLQGMQVYSTAPASAGTELVTAAWQVNPDGTPVWTDYRVDLLDHSFADQAAALNNFGNDYIAGGADDDQLFGQLGDDSIQGDGAIGGFVAGAGTTLAEQLRAGTVTATAYGASRSPGDALSGVGVLTVVASVGNLATDGDDYIEGNGGHDVVFGNLGQDDIVGGSSTMFGEDTRAERPDAGDLLFGGTGAADEIARNAAGDASTSAGNVIATPAGGNARDADVILGDNGDIHRLVGVTIGGTVRLARIAADAAALAAADISVSAGYLAFNYDVYGDAVNGYGGPAGTLRVVPRATTLVDYTPGGPLYDASSLPSGQSGDYGAADEIHGGSGDDVAYGMTGDDILYGDGQNDDLIGGWGNDWISGGTGDDGVIGDDGRLFTSRNSALHGEALYGIAKLLASDPDAKNTNGNVLNEFIYTPGNVQTATINVGGALNKSVDITPFSTDKAWNGSADEYGSAGTGGTGGVGSQPAHFNDDIIYGGLGSDWLHGGTGDDAISGAEALSLAAAGLPKLTQPATVNGIAGVVVVDNLIVSGFDRPYNPGDVLMFSPTDANGQHGDHRTRAGEFALYDEYNPLRKVQVAASASGPVYDFLLNFNPAEGSAEPGGSLPKGGTYPAANNDGGDRIFGDLGNDWLVGGTGRDDLYGGMGNDLMNADDNLDSTLATADKLANNVPDTQPSYEDRAFGGAGRDVLIANTGGDRLIDWTGEFNSYLVPFAPFGTATVSRTLQPQLPEFLYALAASDGADATRAADATLLPGADPTADVVARRGEPFGELGLVLQKDAGWQDTHGGPSDPQAGNIPGGQRDVLRSANFDDGTAQGFAPASGNWTLVNNRFQVNATTTTSDAIGLFNQADTVIPTYFEMQATINAVKPIGGNKANAYLVFDYQGPTNFKYAGINISTNKLEIGHRTANGWVMDVATPAQLKAGIDYVMMLKVNGNSVTLTQGSTSLSFTFAARIDDLGVRHGINEGIVGIGAFGAGAQIDNVVVQAPPGAITLDKTVDFGSTSPASGLFGAQLVTGNWVTSDDGRFVGTATTAGAPAVNLMGIGAYTVTAGSLVDIATTLKTGGQGGVVFDYHGATYFKYAVLSADAKQLVIGHHKGDAWIVDATYKVSISASTDYKLGVTLRGGLVNVSLNGAVVASKLYNESITAGGYGLISFKGANSGQTSFDIVRVKTDDYQYAPPPAALMAAGSSSADVGSASQLSSATQTTLTQRDLDAALAEARLRWLAAGVDAATLARAERVTLQLADLDGAMLGEDSGGTIVIDVDAAGYGWFIDRTPGDDREFRFSGSDGLHAMHGPAEGRMDLLSVVAHELGHAMGFDHATEGVMSGTLAAGVRTTVPAADGAPAPVLVDRTLWADGRPGLAGGRAGTGLPDSEDGQIAAYVIDWNTGLNSKKATKIAAPAVRHDPWTSRFVNHLGAEETRVSPNAQIRLTVPVSARVQAL